MRNPANRLHGARRVLVVVNKWWECDPVMWAMLSGYARPSPALPWPESLRYPAPRPDRPVPAEPAPPSPRAVFRDRGTLIEIWCVSDLLAHLPDTPEYQSSSERKAETLPSIFGKDRVDLVVAVGTAASTDDESKNGCVVVGCGAYLYDAHPDGSNAASVWNDGPFDTLLASDLDPRAFEAMIGRACEDRSVAARLLPPPLEPAAALRLEAAYTTVALSTINVTDTAEYAKVDRRALSAYRSRYDPRSIGSIETTHGLIRALTRAPFVFVSGIANRVGRFDEEVVPRLYAQNTVASHNAGVALAAMLPRVNHALG